MQTDFRSYHDILKNLDTVEYSGKVMKVVGLTVESNGPAVNMGNICRIYPSVGDNYVEAEVVGFRDQRVLLMPFGDMTGIGFGSRVVSTGQSLRVAVSDELIGRVLNALGKPMDDGPPIGDVVYYPVDNAPPNPLSRTRIANEFPLGVRAIDGLLTVGQGQRLGIFAGSGVGKSTLLGMIARNAVADVNVIVLVGERGREVKDFIEKDLGPLGLAKSVLIIATSDQPALLRLKAALVGTSVAEYFRDKGLKVLLLMDSVTRFAMAQREIGMAVGEPPISRGFPPSVYSILPKLLERSGTSDKGSITGLYTVLVEGDDMNEPISDTVRGILDGHIVLSRALATSNHYPAIDVLESISRVMKEIIPREQYDKAGFIKNVMSVYRKAKDLIDIGAYKSGSSAEIDEAIRLNPIINAFLRQGVDETASYDEIKEALYAIG
ncbi:flagellum-specific ATP synthase [Sporobacter termitidis DSM 10068]|uniref:Flagellum-specific ATP synthase n=1 Tax=Sporobacter termitidis DSM 10068 TaxID=1123282 RepID=A0A1M5W8E7_9FIRM|nr:flagellar protein export ATPase FliI [Sporobacter termitidis]SHH83792.1 flagellum-specific ATP synthase [Sporobacter termitidis DSM 10068]